MNSTMRSKFAIVLGYHPVFYTALKHAFRSVRRPSLSFDVVLSWRNVLPSIGGAASAINVSLAKVKGRGFEEGELFFVNALNTFNNSCNLGNIYGLSSRMNLGDSILNHDSGARSLQFGTPEVHRALLGILERPLSALSLSSLSFREQCFGSGHGLG